MNRNKIHDKALFLILLRPLIILVNKLVFRVKIYGAENIPDHKAILAGNHTDMKDCLLLIGACKKPPHFLVKKELYKTKIGNWFFTNSGTISVDRSRKNPEAIAEAKEKLKQNKLIAIFPEGTINRTKNTIMPFKYGAVTLSLDTNSPIIPFVIKGKFKWFRKSINITFLKPIFPSKNLEEYNKNLMSLIKNKLEEDIYEK